MTGVPAGTGMTVTASGLNASGTVTHQGSVVNVSVLSGQTTNVGTITLTPVASTSKTSTVSGTVALMSLNSLVAKRTQKSAVRKAAGQDAAQISIRSYDKNAAVLGSYNLTSGTTGAFAQDVNLSDAGGYVIITATKPGYADFCKRVDYDKPSALNLRAELAKVTTGTGTTNAATNSIDIGVVRNIATGAKSVYSGAALKSARKAAGSQVELEMKLNTVNLPGTTSVIGQFETFNATDPTQAQYFPGAYRGTDTAAGKTGQLVSMAFDYINLTTNQGKDVFKEVKKLAKAGKIRKAADNPVQKVTRWVPDSSCENLFMQDGTPGNGVWDVPIWSVDPYAGDGTWLKIGDGVVVAYNGATGAYDPVAVSDSSSSAAIGDARSACKSSGYYVEITVTNPLYLEKWWNLDHIVLSTAAPKEVCVTGKLVDQNNKALSDVWLYMYDEDFNYDSSGIATLRSGEDGAQSFDYGYGVTDSGNGTFTLKSSLFNNDADRTATISYYDSVNYAYKEQVVTLGESPNCGTATITVTRPAVCTVNGTLSGASSSGELITFYNGGTDYYYNYTNTNADGTFSAEVPCNRELELYVGYNWSSSALFSVNGVVGSFESTDTGSAAGSSVTLTSIIKANAPPEIWGYLDTYYAPTGQSVSAAVYAWDYDGDYPISYSITYTGAAGKSIQVASGTILADGSNTATVALPTTLAAGSYNLNISATDSNGNTSAEYPLGSLLLYDATSGGFAPSIWLYTDWNLINTTDLGTAQIPLYAYASDLDGAATLTYLWKVKYNGADVTAAVGTALAFTPAVDVYNWYTDGYATATFTPPKTIGTGTTVADGGVFTIEASVSDGTSTSTQSIDLKVGTVVTYPGTITIRKPALFKR
jgi:hypothetical protein